MLRRQKQKERKEATTLDEKTLDLTQPTFVWVSEHQKAFDALKVSLTTAPVLGYPDFNR